MNEENLDIDLSVSDEEILKVLAARIGEMLENEPDMLMSLLYRLDVAEKPILDALEPDSPVPPDLGLAHLVLARQKQRAATKKKIDVRPLENPEDWNL